MGRIGYAENICDFARLNGLKWLKFHKKIWKYTCDKITVAWEAIIKDFGFILHKASIYAHLYCSRGDGGEPSVCAAAFHFVPSLPGRHFQGFYLAIMKEKWYLFSVCDLEYRSGSVPMHPNSCPSHGEGCQNSLDEWLWCIIVAGAGGE